MNQLSVGVVIITHRARHHLPYCLPPLIRSPLKPRILLVNSSSNDGTVELARELAREFGIDIETLVIPRKEFNHGTTRERARKTLGTDIVVMTTPDAYASNDQALEVLVKPLLEKRASLAYARQIPHKGAVIWESFPRHFNYPSESHVRSIEDVKKYGVYTFFFSDSFGAYLNQALDEIGGFTEVLTGEDTVACAKLLLKGHRVAYVAEAEVYHSHRYSLMQEFKRHFDTGLARQTYKELLVKGGKDTKRGFGYVKSLLQFLLKENPLLVPYALLQSFCKWAGYYLGSKMVAAPKFLKRNLSAQDFYWN